MSLIAPTANPLLEQTLLTKLQRRALAQGGLGELEPVAVRLGLLQHSLRPRFREPQLVIFGILKRINWLFSEFHYFSIIEYKH